MAGLLTEPPVARSGDRPQPPQIIEKTPPDPLPFDRLRAGSAREGGVRIPPLLVGEGAGGEVVIRHGPSTELRTGIGCGMNNCPENRTYPPTPSLRGKGECTDTPSPRRRGGRG